MQITSLPLSSPASLASGPNKVEASARPPALSTAGEAAASQQPATAQALKPASRTLQARPPELNQQVSRGQAAMSYLGTLRSQLSLLKQDISARLSNPAAGANLAGSLADFTRLWQQRGSASLGSLDGQLNFQPDGDSRQTFKIKGLDARSLERPDKETLSFTTGSGLASARIVTAILEPDQTLDTQVRVLDQALAVANIRVKQDASGEPTLSTPEAAWPSVQDALGIRGGGIRFPAKQFHRVKLEATPPAIRPETWQVGEPDELHQTLQQVLVAQQRIQQAQDQATQALTRLAGQTNTPGPAVSGDWARSFAQDFGRIAEQPGYALMNTVGPALLGVSRDRVNRLLTLDAAVPATIRG